jgi:cytochrome c oxidase cbb3-type subunit 3
MKRDLRRQALIILGALVAMIAAGCDTQPIETAPAGGMPPVKTPIGPIPGAQQAVKLSMNPYAQNQVALQEGRRLFVWYNCAGCHGGHAGGGMGPSLRDQVWIYGDSDAHVFSSIAQGRAHGMPAWGTKLPEEQIWKLVAYVKSLRTPLEPYPPKP